jgi:long-chain fatty acid transport protein
MNTTRYAAAIISLVGVLVVGSAPALGGGMTATQQSATASGMASAYTAIADTPAAGYFNPAGLATQTGLGAELGGTFTMGIGAYRGIAPGTQTEVTVEGAEPYPLVHGHIAYRIHDRVAAGFSVYTPFGLGAAWPETVNVDGAETAWWGRGAAQAFSMFMITLNPNVAVKLHDRVYVGGGVMVTKGVMNLERAMTFSADDADDLDVKMSVEGWGVTANAGVLVKILPGILNFGATYKSAATLTLAGDVVYTQGGSADFSPSLRTIALDGTVEVEVPIPHSVSFGVAAFPVEGLTVALGIDYEHWSRWDRYRFNFVDNPAIGQVADPRSWENTITLRVGAEYRVLPYLPVRAGFIFEQSSVPDILRAPDSPNSDQYEGTVGLGYTIKGFRADLAYMFRSTAGFVDAPEGAYLDGAYRLMMHAVCLTAGYKLDVGSL